jgi:hypothetical protein
MAKYNRVYSAILSSICHQLVTKTGNKKFIARGRVQALSLRTRVRYFLEETQFFSTPFFLADGRPGRNSTQRQRR